MKWIVFQVIGLILEGINLITNVFGIGSSIEHGISTTTFTITSKNSGLESLIPSNFNLLFLWFIGITLIISLITMYRKVDKEEL